MPHLQAVEHLWLKIGQGLLLTGPNDVSKKIKQLSSYEGSI